jgi:hypothetical protein
MNPLLHQLARQQEAELRERTTQAQHGHDLPRTKTRARFTRALLAVMARTRRRREEVGARVPPAGCIVSEQPIEIRVIRQDRPGRALAWRNATCTDEEPPKPARDRDRDLPRQADIGHPLTFFKIPVKRRDD